MDRADLKRKIISLREAREQLVIGEIVLEGIVLERRRPPPLAPCLEGVVLKRMILKGVVLEEAGLEEVGLEVDLEDVRLGEVVLREPILEDLKTSLGIRPLMRVPL